MWNGRTQNQGVRENGDENNIWTSEGESNEKLESLNNEHLHDSRIAETISRI
jgi:hypothetical protein